MLNAAIGLATRPSTTFARPNGPLWWFDKYPYIELN